MSLKILKTIQHSNYDILSLMKQLLQIIIKLIKMS